MLVPARSTTPEWMDHSGHAEADLTGALADIRAVNRFLRGGRVLWDALEPYLDDAPASQPIEILDVGTGGADLPQAIVGRARESGRAVRVTAVELDPVTASIAARETRSRREIRIVRADAFRLPFGAGAFDVVTASLFLHHFVHADAARLLSELKRVARSSVIVNDLRRHRVPWAFIALASAVTRRSAMFRHDAPLSVLRGFTTEELRAIAEDAGFGRYEVRRRWPFRLLLVASCGRSA